MKIVAAVLAVICSVVSASEVPECVIKAGWTIFARFDKNIQTRGSGGSVDLTKYGLPGKNYILTCAHVVISDRKQSKAIVIYDHATRKFLSCTIVKADSAVDLALLKCEVDLPVQSEIGARHLTAGEALWMVATMTEPALPAVFVGNYTGLIYINDHKMLPAIAYIQASLPCIAGCSGGLVYDAKTSKVIGVVHARFSNSIDEQIPHLAILIPAERIDEFLKK